jgi:peptidoglycan/xylan/chitin deacetylase (PgdA/CDA1 family)
MAAAGILLLTFDLEEFDWPCERGWPLAPEQQVQITSDGLARLSPVLRARAVPATFFTTASFASARPEIVRALAEEGHEIASHGLSHADDYATMNEAEAVARLIEARRVLEAISGRAVLGFRAPRLRPPASRLIRDAGYHYGANVHPTWVPGRYQALRAPLRPWREEGLLRIPISVVPWCRWPLSFLWFRAAGVRLTTLAARSAVAATGYLHVYFHPWEAVAIGRYGIPAILAVRTGPPFVHMFERLLAWADDLRALTLAAYARGFD